jgi:hypothetical protein
MIMLHTEQRHSKKYDALGGEEEVLHMFNLFQTKKNSALSPVSPW